jgi:D-hydroxyproline dehydrogenase subunit beta
MNVSPVASNSVPLSRRHKERVAVIGGGIVGLAHAWAAARRGNQVLLFERHPNACGASIRNFGMIWPIGQPNGSLLRSALLSRSLWLEILRDAAIWHAECGSLHLAYRPDELAVLSEFVRLAASLGYECRLMAPLEVCENSPAARRDGLLGGLWSPTELCVDPREVIARLPLWLQEQHGVELLFDTVVEQVSLPWVVASDGRRWQVDRAIVAAGADFRVLYPELFNRAGFRVCKLQMLRTVPQPNGWKLGPMLAGGLTLRHYASFARCESLRPLKERIARATPELDLYGIHVLVSQDRQGGVVLGDSHESGHEVSPFDKAEIENLILRELKLLLELPVWTIQERWHGIYAQIPGEVQFLHEAAPGVTIAIASGGCGMTMSFGLAEEHWNSIDNMPTAAGFDDGR